jgi:hypothetical protein
MTVIKQGWSETITDTPSGIRGYWPYRDELAAHNGLAYRGTGFIILASMRHEIHHI